MRQMRRELVEFNDWTCVWSEIQYLLVSYTSTNRASHYYALLLFRDFDLYYNVILPKIAYPESCLEIPTVCVILNCVGRS